MKKNVPTGKCFVQAGFGNTIVTFSDLNGNTVCWSSAGMLGFKGSRKSTPYAAQVAAEDAGKKAREHGMETRIVRIFNTYGPRMRLNDGRALPNFVHQALTVVCL